MVGTPEVHAGGPAARRRSAGGARAGGAMTVPNSVVPGEVTGLGWPQRTGAARRGAAEHARGEERPRFMEPVADAHGRSIRGGVVSVGSQGVRFVLRTA